MEISDKFEKVPMIDRDREQNTENEPNRDIKKYFGLLLLILGVIVCGFILHAVFDLLVGGDYIRLIKNVVPQDFSSSAPGERSEIVGLVLQALVIIGYIVAIFLLSIATRVAKALLQTGAGLLNSDLATIAERLRKELVKWRKEEY